MEQFLSINKDKDYVISLQKEVGAKPDGVFGPNTYELARKYYNMPVMIHMGKIVPISSPAEINLSLPLYELDDGTRNWYNRKGEPKSVCVHWGGLNSRHCYNVFNMAKGRHVSSHFLVGRNHKSGELEILQCLDTGLTAYHAGKFNNHSIGVDICMHPDANYWEKTKQWYPDASLDHYRGEDKRVPKKEIVMIGNELAEFSQQFLKSLIEATNLADKPICKDNNVYSTTEAAKFAIVGHHNISAKKWDVIPWAEKLYHDIDYSFS